MAINDFLNNCSFGLLVVAVSGKILYANSTSSTLLNEDLATLKEKPIQSVLPSSKIINVIKSGKAGTSVCESTERLYLVEIPNEDGDKGTILMFDDASYHSHFRFSEEIESLMSELEALMNLSGEVVTITDHQGKVLRVSAACERMIGIKAHEYVGKSLFDLQKKKIFSPPTTAQVIETKKMVTVTQETKAGKRFVLRSHPIFGEEGNIEKIIHIGKDVTKEEKLRKSLEETKTLANYFQSELNSLKKMEDEMIIKSKAMEDVYELVSRVANVQATVLILGESGVGKEVVARKIHQLSPRNEQAFIKVNCGAIPENLIESELFGYAKGTFTGANREGKQGLIMAANKGTLFLDEIGELPLDLQVKLLQVLQDKQVTPLGQTTPYDVDVRFLAATNRNLEEMVREGTFRKDLYYRLNVVPITVPPLRDRKEDIPFFINYFLKHYNEKYNEIKTIDKEVIQRFIEKKWDGNVRELQNTIERLVVTVPENHIKIEHLPRDESVDTFDESSNEGATLKEKLMNYEKSILKRELKMSRTMKEASERLGVDISTVSRKAKRYNLDVAELQ